MNNVAQYDLVSIRDDFPILEISIHGKPLVYFDNAASSQRPTQVIDAMGECGIGGFLPKDLVKQFPAGFKSVSLPDLSEYTDDYVIAWSASEAQKRPEIRGLVSSLSGERARIADKRIRS